jgi:hypothetical protein
MPMPLDETPNGGMPMPLDETLIKDAERDFRQAGERAATRLAISFLMAREARRDPMFFTEICGRFEKEIAELGFNLDREDMDRLLVVSRRYFQLMITAADTMAKDEVDLVHKNFVETKNTHKFEEFDTHPPHPL